MKKILSIVLIASLLVMSFGVYAESIAVPTLYEQVEEGYENLAGYLISYENQTLTLRVETYENPVTVYDADNAFYDQLSQLKAEDHISLVAEKGEATYLLSEIKGISPLMNSVMPVLINASLFQVEQEGDLFTLILDENPSTGYAWAYEIMKADHVKFISEDYIARENLIGSGGSKRLTFEVLEEGISTIELKHERSFEEDSALASVTVLVYKTGSTVIIEEDQIVSINTSQPQDDIELISVNAPTMSYDDQVIDLDVLPQEVDGVMMLPLALTLREMGYTVTWNGDDFTVEIQKGAQWTKISIGENAYFKNRMAASPLSAAPIIVSGRTLVPAEFFSVILNIGIVIEDGNIVLSDFESGRASGYVQSIVHDQTGGMTITISNEEVSEDMMTQTILHTSKGSTYFNKNFEEGDYIHAITSMATTMSIPAQTAAYIIY